MQEQELITAGYSGLKDGELDLAEPSPSPNDPPWNSWAAIGVWLASIFFIFVIPVIFVTFYLLGKHVDFSDREALTTLLKSDETAIVLQLLSVIPAHLLTLALAWVVVTKFRTYPFREMLGWEWGSFRIWHAIILFLLFWGFALLMISIFGKVENDFEKMLASSRAAVYLVAFFATFTAPIVEEVVYRGLLYSAFQKRFGMILGIIAVTILFTLVHVPQYSMNNVPDYATISTLLMLSLALTLVRAKTGNLYPCIVLHTLVNGIQSFFLILEPYLPKSLTDTPDPTSTILHLFR